MTTKAEAQATTVTVTASNDRQSDPSPVILVCWISLTVRVTGQAWPDVLLGTSNIRLAMVAARLGIAVIPRLH